MRLLSQAFVACQLALDAVAIAAALLLADPATQPKRDAAADATLQHTGTVISVGDGELTMSIRGRVEHRHAVPPDARITLNGQPARLGDLRPGDQIAVTTRVDQARSDDGALILKGPALAIAAKRDKAGPKRAVPDDSRKDVDRRDAAKEGDRQRAADSHAHHERQAAETDKAETERKVRRGQLDEPRGAPEGERRGIGAIIAPTPHGAALVVGVKPDSPAERSGLRAGDFIVALDGNEPETTQELIQGLREAEAQGRATLRIWRGGQERTLDLAFAGPRVQPHHAAKQPLPDRPDTLETGDDRRLAQRPWLGILLRPSISPGVQVARVYIGSPAMNGGLRPGDRITQINGEPVESPRDVASMLRDKSPGDTLKLSVVQHGEESNVAVTLGDLDEFHQRLFGDRFRDRFENFHQMFDPDFDGLPEATSDRRMPPDRLERLEQLLKALLEEIQEAQAARSGEAGTEQ